MNPQEELNQLRERQEALHQELKERKKELLEAQRLRKDTLKRQIQRAQSRISAAQRKRRTRRLILMGSYLEHVPGDDPDKRDRLIKGLDVCHALRHRPDHIVVARFEAEKRRTYCKPSTPATADR